MTLRRKFNGAKLYTEAWDFMCQTRHTGTGKDLATTKPALNSLQLNRVACLVHEMVGERSIRGEVRAEALVDCMEVRMPE